MNITLAKTAGFCFGVDRAVNMVEKLAEQGGNVCTLGPIIHNAQLVDRLKNMGVGIINDVEEARGLDTLVIRSHGVPREVEQKALEYCKNVVDATCPYVAKIHKIVDCKETVLIAGDPEHEEVIGIMGHHDGPVFTFKNQTELEKLISDNPILCDIDIIVVAQTTFNRVIWEKCLFFLKKVCTKAKIFDTICNATVKRQEEAELLSSQSDVMIVVGGRHSSNTAKLYDICRKNCSTYLIETAAEITPRMLDGVENIGVIAGASTPAFIIKEVIQTMSNQNTEEKVLSAEITDDMSFEEALEASLSSFNTDQKVKGVVLAVGPTEVQVDIGRKQTGYIPQNEYSSDPNVNLMDEVKVGDELDLIVMKTNDQEGTIMLSKRRYDNIANWSKIEAAAESGEVLEGVVKEVIKGGIIVRALGFEVFVPASQATLTRGEDLAALVGKTVPFKILEIRRRRNIIGSVREVLKERRKEQSDKIWETIAVGDVFQGTVKSLTGYGAFVDLGGVDGMVHISELSWQRIKNPAEVVSVGDEIEVYVKALDPEKRKISLGYKKADDNPWVKFMNEYEVGSVINVTIVSLVAYGAFARIIPGVDGLIHISQISNEHVAKPQDVLSVGDEVTVKITAIDTDKKRVSLSMKEAMEPKAAETSEETVMEFPASDDSASQADEQAAEEPAIEPAEVETNTEEL